MSWRTTSDAKNAPALARATQTWRDRGIKCICCKINLYHDPRQLKVAAVRHNAGDDDDGLPFRQSAGQERRVPVGGDERFESHAQSYHRICKEEVTDAATIGRAFPAGDHDRKGPINPPATVRYTAQNRRCCVAGRSGCRSCPPVRIHRSRTTPAMAAVFPGNGT